MFGSAFREFETDPFFDFGNSPFGRHPFFRGDPAASRRHDDAAPLRRPQLPAPPTAGRPDDGAGAPPAAGDPSGGALVASDRPRGRQLERHGDGGRYRRQDPYYGDGADALDVFGGFGAMERHFSQMMDGMQRMMLGMGERMQEMEAAASREDFDGHLYSHSSVYSRTGGGHGEEPHEYHAVSETRAGPGGVRETRRAMRDSRTRDERAALGRHLGDRGHVVERRRNGGSGQQEENHSYTGVDEAGADAFDHEWRARATALADGRHQRRSVAPAPAARERPRAIESGSGGRHKL